jgi:hypothetical protein
MTDQQQAIAALNRSNYAELFAFQTRGMVAGMFLQRGATPTGTEWEYLTGSRDLTMRALSEIATRLGFEVGFSVFNRKGAAE